MAAEKLLFDDDERLLANDGLNSSSRNPVREGAVCSKDFKA